MRILKRDFNDEVSRLLKNGLWLYYYAKQKKIPLQQNILLHKNNKPK